MLCLHQLSKVSFLLARMQTRQGVVPCTCMDDVISVQRESKKDVQRESGVNLSIFEPIIKLSRISMLNSPSMSLTEIKEEGTSKRRRVVDRHMFGPGVTS